MQEKTRIPRWLVESDPSWEKSIDSELGMLKWTKKGTGIQAVCTPTAMFCDVLGQNDNDVPAGGLADLHVGIARMGRQANMSDEIRKYLSSRYLNPGINGPRRDLRKMEGNATAATGGRF